ncbi:auxin efflux carrier [Podospora aff. communis PSN243]|uniref:Auxin efflux carrier n=1 Tax=Podospora aff. communis PSN243 TaxID=3040156 RepID=A0AAV9GBN7_9PEZI|nr:auxin efflux carrier [Podospora aff. communis PSN243]
MASELVTAFLAALQASGSVLLTIFYGLIAGQYGFLDSHAAKRMSQLGVSMLLPALLITNLGSQLHLDTAAQYVPVFVWSLAYNLVSMLIGYVATRMFNLPKWVTPAVAFNNTTSLPLLLVQALGSTGALKQVLKSPDDTVSAALDRAQSYLLVSSIVGNSLTFGLGGDLLGAHDEDPRDEFEKKLRDGSEEENLEAQREEDQPDEETSLLPQRVVDYQSRASRSAHSAASHVWEEYLPRPVQTAIARVVRFVSPPVWGAIIGIVLGLAPPLHRVFFNEPQEGGIFKAWLTSSLKNLGELFVALQVVVVGAKLAHGLRRMKRGEQSGELPPFAVMFVLFVRFVFWPVVSIAVIVLTASKTNLLDKDPVLWFTMMLMPTGPPAMKLTALAEATHAGEEEKLAITKFLSISYALSPIITPTIMMSLKACREWI